MLLSDYQGKDQIFLKRAFIRKYKRTGLRMDDRANKTIIFDWGIHKYVKVTEIMTFGQVYVTDHNRNWQPFYGWDHASDYPSFG